MCVALSHPTNHDPNTDSTPLTSILNLPLILTLTLILTRTLTLTLTLNPTLTLTPTPIPIPNYDRKADPNPYPNPNANPNPNLSWLQYHCDLRSWQLNQARGMVRIGVNIIGTVRIRVALARRLKWRSREG